MPENMPAYAFTDLDVTPALGTAFARSQGGLVVTSRNSDPYWRGTMTTQLLDVFGADNQHADFLAWLIRCCDLNMRVDFVHPRHTLPRSYRSGGWPMIGDGTLLDAPDLRTLTVADIPSGVQLRRGDRLAVYQGDIVVHRWVAVDTLVSSAISQAVPVTPRLPIGVLAPGAIVALKEPKMRFMIVPGSWDAAEVANPSSISFEVMEALR